MGEPGLAIKTGEKAAQTEESSVQVSSLVESDLTAHSLLLCIVEGGFINLIPAASMPGFSM